jgi:hypothetical protein
MKAYYPTACDRMVGQSFGTEAIAELCVEQKLVEENEIRNRLEEAIMSLEDAINSGKSAQRIEILKRRIKSYQDCIAA